MDVEKVDCSKNGGHIIRQFVEYPAPGTPAVGAEIVHKYHCEKCGASLEEIRGQVAVAA